MPKLGKIGLFSLIMLSSSIVTSIRNLPTIAETGMHMFFFAFLAALGFFLPCALVSAELSTGWPELGGIYAWVKHALGEKWGLIGIWLQWSFMIVSMTAKLYFIGGCLAFVLDPSLSQNRTFLIFVNLLVISLFTLLNLRGIGTTSVISAMGFLSGVFLPFLLLIGFGLYYVFEYPIQMDFSFTKANLFPDIRHLSTYVLLLGFIRAFTGVEVSAAHAKDVENPQKKYPIAIFWVVVIGIVVNVLGSISVAVVVPKENISLHSGIMEAFYVFFTNFNLVWLIPILGILVAFGQMGGVSSWLMGPVKGLLATAENGQLPPFFKKKNAHGVPNHLLCLQAVIILISSSSLFFLHSLNSAFWVSVALSLMILSGIYFLLLLSGLVLRYKEPNTFRSYKIPLGNAGMWTVCLVGMITLIFCFSLAFIPPAELSLQNLFSYEGILIGSLLLIALLPYLFLKFKHPSWKE